MLELVAVARLFEALFRPAKTLGNVLFAVGTLVEELRGWSLFEQISPSLRNRFRPGVSETRYTTDCHFLRVR